MSHFEQTLTLRCVWILRDDLLVLLSNNVFSTGFVVRFLTSDICERQQLAIALVCYPAEVHAQNSRCTTLKYAIWC